MTNELKDSDLLDSPGDGAAVERATVGHAGVGLETKQPGVAGDRVAANADALSATKESLEDYTLRFAPRSYRKWSAGVVATSALGGIAYSG
jgi:hypothetical protein